MSLSQEQIYQTLQTIFDDLFLTAVTLTPQLTAHQVEEWDSVMHISILIATENTFNIRFRTGQAESTNNVGEFVALIQSMQDHD